MKVLQVLPALNAGGVERTTLEVTEALVQAGHEAHVVCAGGRLVEELAALGGIFHPLKVGSKNPLKLRAHTRFLIDLVKRENIDIIHARSRAPAWPAHAAARATGRAFITTYHGIYNARSRLKRRYNAVMTKGDIVIANSEFTKQYIISEHGTPADKIIVIPRGVDMALFDPVLIDAKDRAALRAEWGIAPDQTLLLLPGRLTRWKGQSVAIRALAQLDKKCQLVLLGDPQGRDSYVNELWALSESLGVKLRLKIPGHFTNMPLAFSSADIVISASTEPEAFGRVAAEAQAMGRPVIATAHGGAMETVLDHETGLLVPPGDAVALANAIESTLVWSDYDPKSARTRIEENFSKSQLQKRTLAAYQQLLL